jgi:hypothetical protein
MDGETCRRLSGRRLSRLRRMHDLVKRVLMVRMLVPIELGRRGTLEHHHHHLLVGFSLLTCLLATCFVLAASEVVLSAPTRTGFLLGFVPLLFLAQTSTFFLRITFLDQHSLARALRATLTLLARG